MNGERCSSYRFSLRLMPFFFPITSKGARTRPPARGTQGRLLAWGRLPQGGSKEAQVGAKLWQRRLRLLQQRHVACGAVESKRRMAG